MVYDPLNEINNGGKSGLNEISKHEKIVKKIEKLPNTTIRQDFYFTAKPTKKCKLISSKQIFYFYKSQIEYKQEKITKYINRTNQINLIIQKLINQKKTLSFNIKKLIEEKKQLVINKNKIGEEIWGNDYNKLLKQQKEKDKGSENKND